MADPTEQQLRDDLFIMNQLNGLHAEIEELRHWKAEANEVLTAARKHHRKVEAVLRHDCFYGSCDHEEDECPLQKVEVCAECLALAYDINDEWVPDGVLAETCPVLMAIEAMDAASATCTTSTPEIAS